ncbi:MAG: GNAT family N-acetyltransferase [Candidatus Paceibacterota bacterium]|jgi:ribosomal protein S18 acetylase RimI-like enzyme
MAFEDPTASKNNPDPVEEIKSREVLVETLNTPLETVRVEEIKEIDKQVFTAEMALPAEIVDAYLANPRSILTVLKDREGHLVGYVVADPLENAFNDLLAHDNEIELLPNTVYVESIAILPKYRSLKNLNSLLKESISRAREQGYQAITMHTRTTNGLSNALQKRWGAEFKRRIDNWYGLGEPFDYLVIKLS